MEYLLKSSAVIAIFYVCYKLFLQRDTFFEINRWFLLIGLITAFALPFVVIPIYIEYTPAPIQDFVINEISVMPEVISESISIWEYIFAGYLIGAALFLIRFCVQISSLAILITKSKKQKKNGYTFVESVNNTAPFSFFRWMVYNPNQYKNSELEHIIAHEKVHVKQYHSIDIILSQLAAIVFWFNPITWFYKKDLQQNLEFIADYKAQTSTSCKKSYQHLLLKTSLPNQHMALTNNFYNSLIKKRIVMLHKSKSKKINLLKYTLVLPFLALFLMGFNTEEVYIEKVLEDSKPEKVENDNTSFKSLIITKNFSDSDFEELKKQLELNNIFLLVSDIIRNSNNEIIKLTVKVKNTKGSAGATWTNEDNPLPDIEVGENENGEAIARAVFKSNDIKIIFNKDLSDKDLKKIEKKLKRNDIKFTYSNLKRNKKGEISNIATKFEKDGGYCAYNAVNNPIKAFYFKKNNDEIGVGAIKKEVKTDKLQIEKSIKLKLKNIEPFNVTITRDFTDADFENATKKGKEKGVTLKFSKIKRNSKNEIIAIHAEFENEHGAGSISFNSTNPIKPFPYSQSKSNFGFGKPIANVKVIGYGNPKFYQGGKTISADSIIFNKSNKTGYAYKIKTDSINESPWITTLGINATGTKNKKHPLFILDDVEVPESRIQNLEKNKIASISVLKDQSATVLYGKKSKDGAIIITTKKDWNTGFKVGKPLNSKSNQEEFIVSGTVTHDFGPEIQDAMVIIEEKQRGVSTNAKGEYKIKAAKGDKLSFSKKNLVSKEVIVNADKAINVKLSSHNGFAVNAMNPKKPIYYIYGKEVSKKEYRKKFQDMLKQAKKEHDNKSKEVTPVISGIITDKKGKPIQGAMVLNGETIGVMTNAKGEYRIKAVKGDKLTYSFKDMASQEIEVKENKTIDVKLRKKTN